MEGVESAIEPKGDYITNMTPKKVMKSRQVQRCVGWKPRSRLSFLSCLESPLRPLLGWCPSRLSLSLWTPCGARDGDPIAPTARAVEMGAGCSVISKPSQLRATEEDATTLTSTDAPAGTLSLQKTLRDTKASSALMDFARADMSEEVRTRHDASFFSRCCHGKRVCARCRCPGHPASLTVLISIRVAVVRIWSFGLR